MAHGDRMDTDPRRRRMLIAAAGLGMVVAAPPLLAATTGYPTRAIRMLVPYPPGGPTDIVARIVGPRLSELLQQPVVLDNRAGASGMIGADVVAKAPHDGYTLMINVSGQLVNPNLYAKMPHDPLRDFTPIADLASTPIQLVIRADSPVQTLQDLVELVRKEPGRHSFASSSVGTPGHLAGEVFKNVAKLDVQHVPYKGSAPALSDVIGGQVLYMLDSMPSSMSLVRGGKLRSLAVTSAQRNKLLPQVPTFAEAGHADVNLTTWYGMWGPAGLTPAITQQLNATVVSLLAEPEVRQRLDAQQLEAVGGTAEHFAAFCQAEAQRYASIVRTAGIRLE